MQEIKSIKIEEVEIGVGVEVGFIDTFFSSTNPELGKVQYKSNFSNETQYYHFGLLSDSEITATDEIAGASRATTLSANLPISLMDVVQRYTIDKNDVLKFVIAGKEYFHQKRNFYNQFDSQNVEMHLKNGKIVEFCPKIESPIRGMTAKVYVRDEPDKWILHFRILSTSPDKFMVKGCHSLCNGPFPSWVQSTFKVLNLYSPSLYIRERLSQRIPFQTNGVCHIPANNKFTILTSWSVK